MRKRYYINVYVEIGRFTNVDDNEVDVALETIKVNKLIGDETAKETFGFDTKKALKEHARPLHLGDLDILSFTTDEDIKRYLINQTLTK